MSNVRTEYAVQYTEHRDGTQTIDVNRFDRTDLHQAKALLKKVEEFQAKQTIPADAKLVTRTITTTEWAEI